MSLNLFVRGRFYLLSVFVHIVLCIGLLWSVKIRKIEQTPELKVSLYIEKDKTSSKKLHKPAISKPKTKKAATSPVKKATPPVKKRLSSHLNSPRSQKTFPVASKQHQNSNVSSQGFLRGNAFTRLNHNNRSKQVPQESTEVADSILKEALIVKPLLKTTPIQKKDLKKRLSAAPAKNKLIQSTQSNLHNESIENLSWIQQAEKKTYIQQIHNKIAENWILPLLKRSDKKIIIKLVMTSSGQLQSIEFIQTSNTAILNISAFRAVQKALPFPQFPETLGKRNKTLTLHIKFSLFGE